MIAFKPAYVSSPHKIAPNNNYKYKLRYDHKLLRTYYFRAEQIHKYLHLFLVVVLTLKRTRTLHHREL